MAAALVSRDQDQGVSPQFGSAAARAIGEFQRALAALLAALPVEVHRAADLQRALGVDAKLAWQAFRLATASSPAAGAPFLPAAASIERLIAAAHKAGVGERTVAAVKGASASLDECIRAHAGDRARFASMLAAQDEEQKSAIDLRYKAAAFQANCHLRGVQARTLLKTTIYIPGSRPDTYHSVGIKGFVDLERSQSRTPVALATAPTSPIGKPGSPVHRAELDERGAIGGGLSVLTGFCSVPASRIVCARLDEHTVQAQLTDLGLGRRESATVYIGQVTRDYCPFDDRDPSKLVNLCSIEEPSHALVFDVMFAGDVLGLRGGGRPIAAPDVTVYESLAGALIAGSRPRDGTHELHLREHAGFLGTGPDLLETRDAPGYADLVRWACGRVGVDPESLSVFRCRVQYPVLGTAIAMSFPLGARAG